MSVKCMSFWLHLTVTTLQNGVCFFRLVGVIGGF